MHLGSHVSKVRLYVFKVSDARTIMAYKMCEQVACMTCGQAATV
jgi:hypothetical protein